VPPAKQRTPELAEQVLSSALALLASEGVGGLTARRLAERAGTSPAAIYELFGDKGGVVRAMFFSGFEQLHAALTAKPPLDPDPVRALHQLADRYRAFILAHPALSAVMFSRPFSSFEPAPDESAAGAHVRELIVDAIETAVAAERLSGDATDIAHAYVALIHGLAAAQTSNRLGHTKQSIDRRWKTSIGALLNGFHNRPPAP
jgi:AcrR family transcriptional regulator